jgi:hypothetical protein
MSLLFLSWLYTSDSNPKLQAQRRLHHQPSIMYQLVIPTYVMFETPVNKDYPPVIQKLAMEIYHPFADEFPIQAPFISFIKMSFRRVSNPC